MVHLRDYEMECSLDKLMEMLMVYLMAAQKAPEMDWRKEQSWGCSMERTMARRMEVMLGGLMEAMMAMSRELD
jgi:hypothetical protein